VEPSVSGMERSSARAARVHRWLTISRVIDLHCHILPGIDDGPPDEAGSVALGRALVADGCQIVAATPHLREDFPAVRPDELAARCEAVNAALAGASVPPEVVPGGEVDLLWARDASDEELRLVTFGQRGTDLLLETPSGPLPDGFERAVKELQERGVRILLAHPERNPTFQRDPERLARLVDEEVLIQITARSLLARSGGSRELAEALVRDGLAHVVASDAHSAGTRRPPDLIDGVAVAAGMAPELWVLMVVDAPLAVLAGRPLPRAFGGPEPAHAPVAHGAAMYRREPGALWRRQSRPPLQA
jgi:protein-tyrosine phosphatase